MDKKDNTEALHNLLEKISNAPALNGGFDRLSQSLEDIKETQTSTSLEVSKVSGEVQHIKNNFGRLEEKIDRIYDPEDGLFARLAVNEFSVEKTEISIESMATKLDSINLAIEKMNSLEKETKDITERIKTLRGITGDNYEELSNTIKIKNNMSKVIWLFVAGMASGLAKILWDILSN